MQAYHSSLLTLCRAITNRPAAADDSAEIVNALLNVVIRRQPVAEGPGPSIKAMRLRDSCAYMLEHAYDLLRSLQEGSQDSQRQPAAWLTQTAVAQYLLAVKDCWRSFAGDDTAGRLELSRIAMRSGVLQLLAATADSIAVQAATAAESRISPDTALMAASIATLWEAMGDTWPGKTVISPSLGPLSQAVMRMALALLPCELQHGSQGDDSRTRAQPATAFAEAIPEFMLALGDELSHIQADDSAAAQLCAEPYMLQAVATAALLALLRAAAAADPAAAAAAALRHHTVLDAVHMGAVADTLVRTAVKGVQDVAPRNLCAIGTVAATIISTTLRLAFKQLSTHQSTTRPTSSSSSSSELVPSAQRSAHTQQPRGQQQQQQRINITPTLVLSYVKLLLDMLLLLLPVESSVRQQHSSSAGTDVHSSSNLGDALPVPGHNACQRCVTAICILQDVLQEVVKQRQQQQQLHTQQGAVKQGQAAADCSVLLESCSCLETALRACSQADISMVDVPIRVALTDSVVLLLGQYHDLSDRPGATYTRQLSALVSCFKALAATCCCCPEPSTSSSSSNMAQGKTMNSLQADLQELKKVATLAVLAALIGHRTAAAAAHPSPVAAVGAIGGPELDTSADSAAVAAAGLVNSGRILHLLGSCWVRCSEARASCSSSPEDYESVADLRGPGQLNQLLVQYAISEVQFLPQQLQQLQLPGESVAAQAATSAMLEQCNKVWQSTQRFVDACNVRPVVPGHIELLPTFAGEKSELAQQLKLFGAALCSQLPVPFCCNNPDCVNLSCESELKLVGGKGCVCGGCQRARYCGSQCQKQHWKQHKPVCKRLR